jgi:cysteine synthase A
MSSPAVVDSVLAAIGHTPVVRLRRIVPATSADVFVKLEYFNPTGSYKDRMALAMIDGAEARGALRPGMRVIEFTGGSTGSSLAMVCAIKGYEFTPLSSDAFAREKIETMRAFGANVEMVPSDGGTVTPALFDRFRARIATLQAQPGTFWTDQFNNADALDGYRNIGVELLEQLGTIDAFCGAVGTAGMAGWRLARVESGRQPRAHHCLGADGIAGVDDRPRRRASRRGHRDRPRAAASREERLR